MPRRYPLACGPSRGERSAGPVSLLAVGRFVGFPGFARLRCSFDRTKALPRLMSPSLRKSLVVAAASTPARLVVLLSGSGTNLQALLDAVHSAGPDAYGARVVAVGADRDGIEGLARAERANVPTFVCRVRDYADRADWDRALAEATAAHAPDLVVSAGFMRIVGREFLARFGGRFVNTHPALLPSFPGAHGVRDALAYGVKVTGCTVHFVDDGVDTGPIIAQGVVEVRDEDHLDDGAALHERIKEVERRLLVNVVGRLARDGYRIEGRKVRIPA